MVTDARLGVCSILDTQEGPRSGIVKLVAPFGGLSWNGLVTTTDRSRGVQRRGVN